MNKRFITLTAITAITVVAAVLTISSLFLQFNNQETNAIPVNVCEQKLNSIAMAGTWEYYGEEEESPYWKLELAEDNTFKYFERRNDFVSSGAWQFNAQERTITLSPQDNLAYWNSEFFTEPELTVQLIPDVKKIDSASNSVTFNVNEYQNYECDHVYKAINFFGWNFVKSS